MKHGSAQFCAACHKVHLDVPVNKYRWVRGFNEYDNWLASGISGQGQPKPGQPKTLLASGRNSLEYSFDPKSIPADVSGEIKGRIPNLPIITLAQADVSVPLSSQPTEWKTICTPLGRIYYFRALIEKADGNYDAALKSLERVESQYPHDRVVLNQIVRILFLKRQYAKAIDYLQRVCDIDPEDVQMHYTAMLCYRGLGDSAKADREEILFRRYKANEASQTITAQRRMASPEDNNERQPIHDHESVPLS